MDAALAHARGTYRARMGDRTIDITLGGDTPTIDGRPVEVAFDAVGAQAFSLRLDGRSMPVVVESVDGRRVRLVVDGRRVEVTVEDEKDLLMARFGLARGDEAASREVRAPMPGLVHAIAVAPGQAVAAGDSLLVLEAMKMENELRAEADGTVAAVHVAPGDAVSKGTLLIEFEA